MKLEIGKSFTGKSTVQDPSSVGRIIRQLRKESKLTQAKAAALCNVGPRFLSDLENGKSTIQLGKALKVLHAFGLLVVLKKKNLVNE